MARAQAEVVRMKRKMNLYNDKTGAISEVEIPDELVDAALLVSKRLHENGGRTLCGLTLALTSAVNGLTTELLTLEVDAEIARLTMRGKTVRIGACHGETVMADKYGKKVTLGSEIGAGSSVVWPLRPEVAQQMWDMYFK